MHLYLVLSQTTPATGRLGHAIDRLVMCQPPKSLPCLVVPSKGVAAPKKRPCSAEELPTGTKMKRQQPKQLLGLA